ncbi:hypothetical protein BJX99DRAFT_256626 [Aspergillus californicus]
MTPCPKCEEVEGKIKCACGAGPVCEPCYSTIHLKRHSEHKKASWRTRWMRGFSETLTLSFGEKYFQRDEHTKWFGYNVEKLENGGEVGAIIETMRFQDLVERARAASSKGVLFPSVVAFVGETGINTPVDLILSIGSGIGTPTEPSELNANGSVPWVKELMKTFFQNMNGDALWKTFWEGNHAHHKCARRLNVRFQRTQEYQLDDVLNIDKMHAEAKTYTFIPYGDCQEFHEDVHPTRPFDSLSEIATRLRASLLFFQLDSIAHTMHKDAAYIIGDICCRLDRRTTSYAKLGTHPDHTHNPGASNAPGELAQPEANLPGSPLGPDDHLRDTMTAGTRLKYRVAFVWAPTNTEPKLDIKVHFTDELSASMSGFPVTLEVLQDYDQKYNIR